MPDMLFGQLQVARRVEREAARLYVMSDAELASPGYAREEIRGHLLEACGD